jgi:hypothetical protein
VPGISRDVARRLARTALAHTCWKARSGLLMEPCYWTAQNGIVAVAFAPDGQRLEDEQPGAVVVEKHHPFRPTQMVGACLRGRLVPDRNAEEAVAVRYGLEDRDIGASFRVEPARILSWRGFETQSQAA